MKKILIVNGGTMDFGGISVFIKNYLMNMDLSTLKIDILVHGLEEGKNESELKALGVNIIRINTRKSNLFGYKKSIYRVLKTGKYDVIHVNMDSQNSVFLKPAKKLGIPLRISHSHNTQNLTNNKIRSFYLNIKKRTIIKYSNLLLSCSNDAGTWLYGKKSKFTVLKNAINLEEFLYDYKTREELKKHYSVANNYIIGSIGRVSYQKNQDFILNLAEQFEGDNEIKFIIIGQDSTGGFRDKIIANHSNVLYLGEKPNINKYYNMFDLFILPSKFEGLGIVGIEAQANGLDCIFSSNVPREIAANNNIDFIELDLYLWIEKIKELKNNYTLRIKSDTKKITNLGYCIKNEVLHLEKIYNLNGEDK